MSDPRASKLTPSLAQIEAANHLVEVLGEPAVSTATFRDNVRVYVNRERLILALDALRQAGFDLVELGCTDYLKYPATTGTGCRFEVHYALLNRNSTARLVVKVGVNDPDPTLPTTTTLWLGAEWMEREVFDMYGIRFDGHPDLRRILMPEEFSAHPLRKDYPLRGRGERHNFPVLKRDQS